MAERKIAIIYHSQETRNTRAASEFGARGVRRGGKFEVFLKNTDDGRVGPTVLEGCAGVAIGTPDYFSYPAGGLKTFMDDWLLDKRSGRRGIEGMPIALLVTHGGGGLARTPHEELFRHIGPQVGKTLSIRGKPRGEVADACIALGKELAVAAAKYLRQDT